MADTPYHSVPAQNTNIYLGEPQFRGFDSKAIRSAFASKVYGILSLQLAFATCLIGLFTLHKPTNDYFSHPTAIIWLYSAMVVGLVVYFVLVCIDSARRKSPINYLLLFILTVSFALMAAVYSAQFDAMTVLYAVAATALSTIVIMLLAKFSPFDITACGCGLCILGLVHLLVAFTLLILVSVASLKVSTASLMLACFGAFLMSLYLLFDLQMIMGGRSIEISPEEYIIAAVQVYIDIVYIFQYMLVIFGSRD